MQKAERKHVSFALNDTLATFTRARLSKIFLNANDFFFYFNFAVLYRTNVLARVFSYLLQLFLFIAQLLKNFTAGKSSSSEVISLMHVY